MQDSGTHLNFTRKGGNGELLPLSLGDRYSQEIIAAIGKFSANPVGEYCDIYIAGCYRDNYFSGLRKQ